MTGCISVCFIPAAVCILVYTPPVKAQSVPDSADLTFFAMGDCQYGGGPYRDKNLLQIIAMNNFPGTIWPAELPSGGERVAEPAGLLMAGDLTHRSRPDQVALFNTEFGMDGTDGLLRFPVYEGYGNHDYWRNEGDPEITYGVQAVWDRNARRKGMTALSDTGGHYSWDWQGIHFINLNDFPGNRVPVRDSGGVGDDPYFSLDFMVADLEERVGNSGRPVVIMTHLGLAYSGTNNYWWEAAQRKEFIDIATKYNIIAYIHGHWHDTEYYRNNGIDVFNVGSSYYDASNPDSSGHFAVFRIKGNIFEAADVAWRPAGDSTRAEFVDPTDDYPVRGWRIVKAISGLTPESKRPFALPAVALPDTVEAENYDFGGEGVSFHEAVNDSINQGKSTYRYDGVDIEDNGRCNYRLAYTAAGEWLEYTVQVPQAMTFNINALVANGRVDTQFFHLELEGDTIGRQAVVPNTGGADVWDTVSLGEAHLQAGQKVIRLVIDKGNFKIDNIRFESAETNIASIRHAESAAFKAVPVSGNTLKIIADAAVMRASGILLLELNGRNVLAVPAAEFVDWGGVSPGVYWVVMQNKGHRAVRKVVKYD